MANGLTMRARTIGDVLMVAATICLALSLGALWLTAQPLAGVRFAETERTGLGELQASPLLKLSVALLAMAILLRVAGRISGAARAGCGGAGALLYAVVLLVLRAREPNSLATQSVHPGVALAALAGIGYLVASRAFAEPAIPDPRP